MDITKLVRDKVKVRNSLKVLPDKSVVTTTGCSIYIPETFRSKQLLSFSESVSLVGHFAMVLPTGEFSSTMIPSFFRSKPAEITTVEIDGTGYYCFKYLPGNRVFETTDLLKDNILLYYLFEEILARGRIPWYYDYLTLGKFFHYHRKYTGTSLVPTPSVGEMIIGLIARLDSDRTRPLREVLKTPADLKKTYGYSFIPMRNVEYGASDTASKLVGNYAAEGMDAAIVNPSTKVRPVESLLRA